MQLIASTVTGQVGKQLYRVALQGLKLLGWLGGPFGAGAVAVTASIIAGATTYGFGWACNAYYKSGMKMELEDVGIIYEAMFNEGKQKNKFI